MDVSVHIEELSAFVEQNDFAGYDPYDALNSPVLRFLSCGRKYGRIGWTQLMRRSPINLRPVLLIPRGYNPKGLALFLGGYAKLSTMSILETPAERIRRLVWLLKKTRSAGFSGNCWGYNFDWQSRAFYLPKYTPTIVNSSFIGHALLDAFEFAGEQQALDMAVSIADFIMNDLKRTKEGDTFCFSYTPIDSTAVHNANLLGASLLIRLYSATGRRELREAALASLAYSMKYQRDDGAWFYAETGFQKWIDSFHTGFNLESIRWFLQCGEAHEWKAAYEKGVQYYAEHLFLEDGTPKYYHNRVHPIDIHSPAEAVTFFAAEGSSYKDLTDVILSWMIKNLRDERGYYYFRKGKYVTNKIPYMRWGQAWAFRALTAYAYERGKRTQPVC